MKKHLALLWPVAFVTACHDKPTEQQNTTDSVSVAAAPVAVSANAALDTFSLAGKTCIVYPAATSPFKEETQEEGVTSEDREHDVLAKDTAVKRVNDTLYLRVDSGEPVAMGNNNEDDGDSFVKYYYEGFMPEINCYCIAAHYYEGYDYILLNRATGANVHCWSRPVLSPDKKQLICSSYDMEAGFIPNGYQLLGYNNGKVEVLGEVTLDEWGPGQVQWLDNNTLLAEHMKPNLTGSGDVTTELRQTVKIVIQ